MYARIGLVGLGEAGTAFAEGLSEAGATVCGYDPAVGSAPVEMAGTPEELAKRSDVLICLTSAASAAEVAGQFAPHLTGRHIYCDFNSAGPQVKREVARTVAGTPFVDGAVMAAVPPHRQAVPVLVSGGGARELVRRTEGFGLRLEVLGEEPGQASAVKMFRSLLVKGLEALIMECLLGAEKYGATDRVLSSMNGSLPMSDWHRLASYLMSRTVAHGRRRAEELQQVAATLHEAGIEPVLAEAGARRLREFADRDTDGGAGSGWEVIHSIAGRKA